MLTLTARGVVGDYADTSSLRHKIGTAAGVDSSLVSISVVAASVLITATIAVPAHTNVAAVQDALSSALPTAAAASTALGITVESMPVIHLEGLPPPPSMPPSSAPAVDVLSQAGFLMGAIALGLMVLVSVIGIVYMNNLKKRAQVGSSISSSGAAAAGKPPRPQQQLEA